MWIYTTESFLSLVRDETNKKNLLVRNRFNDIEKVFPSARVKHTPDAADYAYRTSLPASVVAKTIARQIETIDYPNFKSSIADEKRAAVYHTVWEIMRRAQAVWR